MDDKGFFTSQSFDWLSVSGQLPAAKTDAELASAGDLFLGEGRFNEAINSFLQAIELNPRDAGYHFKLATAAWRARKITLAEKHFREVMRLAPADSRGYSALARLLFETGKPEQAVELTERAMALAPQDLGLIIFRCFLHEVYGEFDEVLKRLRPLIASGVKHADIAVLLNRMASTLRSEQEAVDYVTSVLNEPKQTKREKARLYFALCHLLDRLGRYDEAFAAARQANEYDRGPYDPKGFGEFVDGRIRYFSPAKLHDLPRASHGSRRPIFIVGMPRSGTTLVEQILASHPQVYGGGELTALPDALLAGTKDAWTLGDYYPKCLEGLSVRVANEIAELYLAAIKSLDSTSTYVTDKLHQNFAHVGVIALLFPDCHIIHCKRDPLDTCLSCYMSFLLGNNHTQDLKNLGLFYRDYERLMDHWKRILNLPMIEVQYEKLVYDTEGQTRRLLELLDLPWEERCLRYYETKRAVATLSNEQVRKPIYESSIGRWKHYEKHLGELMLALGHIT